MTKADFRNISVVLVNTSHPGNIGASARAMNNMGLTNLVLVRPKEFPSGVAIGRAASAVALLDNARVVDSLTEAVADCGLVIGASARSRRIPWPLLTPAQCAEKALEAGTNRVALVFGREDTGLSNEELRLCHYHVRIPANPGYSSLNLAAAVMVICYELYKTATGVDKEGAGPAEREWDQELATGEDLERFYRHLESVLIAVDFHDPENPRQLMQRIRRLFGRIRIDVMEMSILRGMLSNIEQNLRKRDPMD